MTSGFSLNGNILEKNGEIVGRIERGMICDEKGGEILRFTSSEIKNKFGTVLAKVEKGKILSMSGHELSSVVKARLCFENCNTTPDIEVGALWVIFVKGMN